MRAAVDPIRPRAVFYGGEAFPAAFLDDAQEFALDSNVWKPAPTGPSSNCHYTFLTDKTRARALMFGGFPRNKELWAYDFEENHWTNITPEQSPERRCLHAAVISPVREEMIVYGGLMGGFEPDLADTWSYDLKKGTWTRIMADSPPGKRYGCVAAFDSKRNRMLVFGGLHKDEQGTVRETDELWSFNLESRQWRRLEPANGGPSPRQFGRGTVILDGDGLVLFGGRNLFSKEPNESEFKNDLWHLRFSELKWTKLEPGGEPPPPRFRHTVFLDAESRLHVLFGEGEQREHDADLWRLDRKQLPLTIPSPKLEVRMEGDESIMQWQVSPVETVASGGEPIIPFYRFEQSFNLESWAEASETLSPNKENAFESVRIATTRQQQFFRLRIWVE